jgi:predicted ATPase
MEESVMLRKLTVKNFKRFKDTTSVTLDPITMLIGANNSGKSTVLQALSIFQYCIDVTRRKKNGGYALETKTIGPEEFGALPVAAPTDLWPDGKAGTGPISIEAEFDGGVTISFSIKLSFNRFSITPSVAGDAATLLETIKIRHVPIHTGLAPREEYLLVPARADRIRELQYGSVIRNLLWELKDSKDKDGWKRLKAILKRLYPEAELDVTFDKDVDRFINSEYHDGSLSRSLDVVVSGTGFQQALQIFSGVLSQGSSIVLMDEPDAHLHARLQVELMGVFEDLARDQGIQFVLATHSPHLLAAAPEGSLRAMIDGRAHPFAQTPEHMDVLDTLGAFDRMEVVQLLRTKAVVFVENRDDRDILWLFAEKLWGDRKAREIWDRLSFLFTYQEPISADAKQLARQVKDLLTATELRDLAGNRQPKFLVIGDRDYRSAERLKEAWRETEKKARGPEFGLDLSVHVWSRNEIENYLVDREALLAAAASARDSKHKQSLVRKVVGDAFDKAMVTLREEAQMHIAAKLQHEDHALRGDFVKTSRRAEEILAAEWTNGSGLCDAKRLLSGIRRVLQEKGIRTRVTIPDIIGAMKSVPEEVAAVLKKMQRLGYAPRMRSARRAQQS